MCVIEPVFAQPNCTKNDSTRANARTNKIEIANLDKQTLTNELKLANLNKQNNKNKTDKQPMKRIVLSMAAALTLLSLNAQSALDLQSRATLRQLRANNPEVNRIARRQTTDSTATICYTPVMIRVDEGVSNEQLEEEGILVNARRGDIVFASVAIDEIERVADLKTIKQMQLPRDVQQKMDRARTAIGVDKIHAGEGLPQAYTGKGVVTGIVDGGIDPNNINFKKEDGTTRVEYLTHIYANSSSQSGYSQMAYNSATISRFRTDDSTAYHGTHTMGIMAGSYKGNVKVAETESQLKTNIVEKANPFYGMAPESDIVASCGTLQDYFIALGVESTLQYAYDMKKPAVVNLSLGSNTGSHDGKGIIGQYLEKAGEEAIICLAAGNEGDLPIALNKTLQGSDMTVQSFIKPLNATMTSSDGTTYQNLRYGTVYIYSNDSTQFDIKAVLYRKSRQAPAFNFGLEGSNSTQSIYYATSDYKQSDTDKTNTVFSQAFNGYVGIGTQYDSNSKRYYAMIDYFVFDNTKSNSNADVILGFSVTGKKAGQRIDCFCDGTYTVLDGYNFEGWSNGSQNGSISDMACGENILVVGAYNSKEAWGGLDGKRHYYEGSNGTNAFPEGEVSAFSSYGTTITGKNLPDICAPGTVVISTISQPYSSYVKLQNYPSDVTAQVTANGKTYYWAQAMGTSMACPVVAGAIALWLQANPNLTIADVKDIVAKTAVKDEYVTNSTADPIQWGAGKFDAYAGLKEAIRRNAVENTTDNTKLLIRTADSRHFEVFLAGAKTLTINLYDISGRLALSTTAQGDETQVDATGLAAGVYVLQAGNQSEKIVVR